MEYYYIKVIHIVALVSWMAMLFYLPRLLVYHAEHRENKGFCEVVAIQERKLFLMIGYPAMIGTLISGVLMIYLEPSLLQSGGWLHAKLLIVALLILYHFSLSCFAKKLQQGTCQKSGRFFRLYNEIPTIALIIITILVILKPF